MTVTHSTFTLERTYPAPVERVFAAWADPAAKAAWFAAGGEHELDFRPGGREVNRARHPDGPLMVFETLYREIVPGQRLVYSSALSADDVLATASQTTVLFEPDGEGTRLTLVEQGAYLDGREEPAWRETGTGGWLDALGTHLTATAPTT
jgi:uncharacterized protein YndB with AHSA1/START domain